MDGPPLVAGLHVIRVLPQPEQRTVVKLHRREMQRSPCSKRPHPGTVGTPDLSLGALPLASLLDVDVRARHFAFNVVLRRTSDGLLPALHSVPPLILQE